MIVLNPARTRGSTFWRSLASLWFVKATAFGFWPHLDGPDVSDPVSVSVSHCRPQAKQAKEWQALIDGHLLRSCVWSKKKRKEKRKKKKSASALCTWRHTSKLKVTHTQKHKQTDGKESLRISGAGSAAALHKVTRDVSGHEDQRRGSPCLRVDAGQTRTGLPAPPRSQIITGPPKTKENNLIGMLFEFFFLFLFFFSNGTKLL